MDLREHAFFRGLESENVGDLLKICEARHYERGQNIFEENSSSDGLYLILEGKVAFVKKVARGGCRVISYASEGDFFGEIGIFTGAKRALGAMAETHVSIGRIPREALLNFIHRTPGPIEKILQSIVNHLHHTTSHYVDEMLHQEKMAVVGGMANTIIHDFKNPFTLISLGAEMLAQKHKDEHSQQLCRNISAQVGRMVEMANEIIDFSAGEQKLSIGKVNIEKLINRFRELNEPYFRDGRLSIEIDVRPVVIEAEENKLLRVIQNLVGNAIEALEKCEHPRIVIKAERSGDELTMIIGDNGKGIPEEIRDRFFDPFVTYGKSRGTGLGTAIVKSIIESHHGRISFDSQRDKGTTFYISLPLVQPDSRLLSR